MTRAPDARIKQAKAMYLEGKKLVEIANQLELPEGTVRRWKSTHNWDSERSDKKASVRKGKGAPRNNKNAVGHGAPKQNNNAEKFGFFRKYLPQETFSIIKEMPKDPLDILFDQIQITYAAIIRAQQIMYVTDINDMTTTKIKDGCSQSGSTEEWEVQQAWDKQASFLKAQARAQGELRSMIKQYDDLLHKNWDLATEEQKARIEQIKVKTEAIREKDGADEEEKVVIINDVKGNQDK